MRYMAWERREKIRRRMKIKKQDGKETEGEVRRNGKVNRRRNRREWGLTHRATYNIGKKGGRVSKVSRNERVNKTQ